MINPVIFRKADLEDIPFLVKTIIEAEKSGTDILSYQTVFGLDEKQTSELLVKVLEEEEDHCELSLSSFLVAEQGGEIIGAVGAWVEAMDEVPSTMIKGNLLGFYLPREALYKAAALKSTLQSLHLEYKSGTIQIGLVFVAEKARGQGIPKRLIEEQVSRLLKIRPEISEAYVQVFANNLPAIKAYEKFGFKIIETRTSEDQTIHTLLPYHTKINMKTHLNN